MSTFFEKYYKPWSILWIIQRSILKLKDIGHFNLSPRTLWNDYKLTKKTNKSIQTRTIPNKSDPEPYPGDSISQTGNLTETNTIPLINASLADKELSKINTYFDHVYIVNLLKRNGRRINMVEKLNALKIRAEIFQAVDGYTEQNLKEFENYLNSPINPATAHENELKLKRKVIYSPGAWGTLKTYGKLIRDAKEKGYEKILSLEDDVIFAKDFESLFIKALKIIPDNWKLLYLGASQHSWQEGKDLIYHANSQGDENKIGTYLPLRTDGAFAIGIHQSVYDLLLREIDRMNCSFDSGALQTVAKSLQGECFVLSPNLIIADVEESDNSLSRKMKDFAKTVHWNLDMYDF